MEKSQTQKLENNPIIKDTLLNIIKILLGGGGVLSALLYFLGRLHVESYYYSLGISPSVLSFSIYDYMFSSFDLVIMCVFVIIIIFGYWFWAKPEVKMEMGFPFLDKEKELEKVVTASQKEQVLNSIKNRKNAISFIYFLWGFFFFWLFIAPVGTLSIIDNKGCMGFYAGFVVGIISIFTAWKSNIRQGGVSQLFRIIFVTLILVVLLPITANRLAQKESQRDVDVVFPEVSIVSKDSLPYELYNFSPNANNIINGELVIVNNGIYYILQSDNTSIYAMQGENIKDIIYKRIPRGYILSWQY
jgi:hypothetical protein